jgi:hypothetical protein
MLGIIINSIRCNTFTCHNMWIRNLICHTKKAIYSPLSFNPKYCKAESTLLVMIAFQHFWVHSILICWIKIVKARYFQSKMEEKHQVATENVIIHSSLSSVLCHVFHPKDIILSYHVRPIPSPLLNY